MGVEKGGNEVEEEGSVREREEERGGTEGKGGEEEGEER